MKMESHIDESPVELKVKLDGIRTMYREGEYKRAGQHADEYLRKILYNIYMNYFLKLSHGEQKVILDKLSQIENLSGDVQPKAYTISQFARLFDITKCITILTSAPTAYPLVHSFNIDQIGVLLEFCKEPDKAANQKLLKLGFQQIIQFATLLSYLTDTIELKDEEFIDGIKEQVIKKINGEYEKLGFKERFFLFNEERGLLLNRADQTRNVAFKIETFSNLLIKIYTETTEILKKNKIENEGRIGRDVIMNAGKDSGSRFGRALDTQFQREGIRIDLNERIEKWCDFDSDVGFGKFDSNKIRVEEKTNKVEGEISLQENFLTVQRKISDDNMCCFMKGYIWGVLEELTGMPLMVSHKKKDCAQFKLNSETCIFNISVNKEAYEIKQHELESIDLGEEL